LAYAAESGVWFDVWSAFLVFGRTPRQRRGSGFPLQLLRNFRFNPLRLAYRRLFLLIGSRRAAFIPA
jgi:hypothetical protein